jgi:lysophospholipase L1-like esterase
MKRIAVLNLTVVLVGLIASAGGVYAASPESEPVAIVAFGDSTTAARGSTTVYATILQDELRHVRVINAGVGGNTTEMARKRFEADVLSHRPRIAIIQFGINDAAVDVWKTPAATQPRVSLDRYEANLRFFVRSLQSSHALVVLMTPNPLRWTPKLKELYGRPPYKLDDPDGLNILLTQYSEAVRRVARDEHAALIDVQQAFADDAQKRHASVDALLSDGMHPNDDGQRIVAELLRKRILTLAKTQQLPIEAGPHCEIFTAIASDGKEFNHNSYPTVATLPDGRLFLTWEAGTGKSSNTRVVGAFSSDGGRTWDKPETIIDTPLLDCDPTIILTSDEIQVYSTTRPHPEITYTEMWKTSRKFDGARWSQPVRMPAYHKYEVGKIHIGMTLADGTLLMPYSWDVLLQAGKSVAGEGKMLLKSGVMRSRDHGQTWTPGGDMFVEVTEKKSARGTGGVCEPAMVLLPGGEIFALLRTSDSWLYQSRSRDGGLSWDTPAPSPLAGHNSPAALCRLRNSGDVLVVWNNSPLNRWPLDVALSTDGCKTWSKPHTLANKPGFQSAYPSATQAADGTLIAVWFQMLPGNARELRIARFSRQWLVAEPDRGNTTPAK